MHRVHMWMFFLLNILPEQSISGTFFFHLTWHGDPMKSHFPEFFPKFLDRKKNQLKGKWKSHSQIWWSRYSQQVSNFKSRTVERGINSPAFLEIHCSCQSHQHKVQVYRHRISAPSVWATSETKNTNGYNCMLHTVTLQCDCIFNSYETIFLKSLPH